MSDEPPGWLMRRTGGKLDFGSFGIALLYGIPPQQYDKYPTSTKYRDDPR